MGYADEVGVAMQMRSCW